jgi:tetratricopeptide (TPR) repeat protein
MKYQFLIGLIFLSFTAFISARLLENTSEKFDFEKYKAKNIVRCSTDWEKLSKWLDESDIPALPGTGNYVWKISTQNDSAQFYFNQGINLYYGFHIPEAMASFQKAKRFDPECAMLWWALALGYGPNINDLGYNASPESLEATKMAVKLSSKTPSAEKSLIDAMSVRYSSDSNETRKSLNEQYREKMAVAYRDHPSNYDIGTLYTEAMMLEHPWDLWNTNGTPKSWTPLIQQTLEKILDKSPDHPGANHYYIHVMEPSPYFAKALSSAEKLGRLTPGIAHMVHMPSHIYLRSGKYNEGITVNENAEKSYKSYLKLFPQVIDNAFLYQWHAKHMELNCAMMAGEKAKSEKLAKELQAMMDPSFLSMEKPLGSYIQYLYYSNILVYVKFGNWENLLNMDEPHHEYTYARVLYHFGRGMAFTGKNAIAEASDELIKLRDLMHDEGLKIPLSPFSAAIEGATIAENLLAGTIYLNQKQIDKAIENFRKASGIEENMVYNEPRDWLLNPKPFWGNALLHAKKINEAEKAFTADLKNNQENGWSLYGLYKVSIENNDAIKANELLKRYQKAFKNADIYLSSPVY